MFGLLENCAKTESHTTSIAHEITELLKKIKSMKERIAEMNDCVTKVKQIRNNPLFQIS